jgi:hypothetical protein
MPIDNTIFGLRFGSNAEMQPTLEELRAFLASPKEGGKREPRGDVLASYLEMLDRIERFERDRRVSASSPDLRDKMFLGALRISSFFNPSLKTAVMQYLYQCHALLTLDFKKPTAFIRSAEEEMGRLNPKKKEDGAKLAKLSDMVEERKRTLAALVRRQKMLGDELRNIARYITDNLVKIKKLCEASIVVLVDFQIAGKEANRLIEDIQEHFKDQLTDSLDAGPISPERFETIQQDVAALSEELAALLREDVYALTGLFETIHEHAQKLAGEIDTLTKKTGSTKNTDNEDEGRLFAQIESCLVSLVSDIHFELKAVATRSKTAHDHMLVEKRKEIVDSLFALLEKERRARSDRRSGEDRRRYADQHYAGPERRTAKKRRSGKSRR